MANDEIGSEPTSGDQHPASPLNASQHLAPAFVSAALVFAPIYWFSYLTNQFKYPSMYVDLPGAIIEGFGIWDICLAVILGAMFVVALPVEGLLVVRLKRPNWLKSAAIYPAVMVPLGVGAYLLQLITPYPNNLPFALAAVLVIGAGIAFISRMLYPLLLTAKKVTKALVTVLIVTAALPLVSHVPGVPHTSAHGSPTESFFPNRGNGELARATYLAGESPTTEGMHNYSSGSANKTGVQYWITFGCHQEGTRAVKYLVKATDDQGMPLKRLVFNCGLGQGIFATSEDFNFGSHHTSVHLSISPIKLTSTVDVPTAYAVIAPTSTNY